MIVADAMPEWLAARCLRMLDKADRQEGAALQLAERPDCTEGARVSLHFADDIREDVAAVASEWAPEVPSDA